MRLILVILLFIFSTSACFAQKKGWDTTYYTKYRNRLIVSFFQSYRNYGIDIEQKLVKDSLNKSKTSYIAEANLIYGLELNYDKFNISVGFKNPSRDRLKKGDTKYQNYALNVG